MVAKPTRIGCVGSRWEGRRLWVANEPLGSLMGVVVRLGRSDAHNIYWRTNTAATMDCWIEWVGRSTAAHTAEVFRLAQVPVAFLVCSLIHTTCSTVTLRCLMPALNSSDPLKYTKLLDSLLWRYCERNRGSRQSVSFYIIDLCHQNSESNMYE